MKNWCVQNRANCLLLCMDDKAKVAVGNPGTPEAATTHNRRALTTNSITLESSDHNYHSVNLTPSVTLICDTPTSASSSFYAGQVWVGVKDSIFEGSDPVRHVIELLYVLRSDYQELPPYCCIFSDGGADHNITFLYVQCALLALFKIGDFDVLNVGRCAPNQSYINPAERCMSLLNIGLQGLALERDHMGPMENVITSCKSMKAIRLKSKEQQGLKEIYQASIEAPRKILESCFEQLELKGTAVKIFQPNKDDSEVLKALNDIDIFISKSEDIPHSRSKLKDFPSLKLYFDEHLAEGLYMLQFRKCDRVQCCVRKIDKLPPTIPAPFLAPDKEHYLPFDLLYGKVEFSEKDCPSLSNKIQDSKKKNKEGYKYLANRVVATINCQQCRKSRCVFSLTKSLSVAGQQELEDILFSCGSTLETSNLYTGCFITCMSQIESAFYLSKPRSQFICVHCGDADIDCVAMINLFRQYNTVHPSCEDCKIRKAKKEICSNPKIKAVAKKPVSIELHDRSDDSEDDEVRFNVDYTVKNSRKRQSTLSNWVKGVPTAKKTQSLVVASDKESTAIEDTAVNDVKINKTSEFADKEDHVDTQKETDDMCVICDDKDPPGRAKTVVWVDCDICHIWAHLVCAKNSEWRNIQRNNCLVHAH